MSRPQPTDVDWRKSSRSGPNANCVEAAAVWRKSTHSGSNSNCVEVAPAWVKSTHSGFNSDCVEAAPGLGHVAVRDSKNPNGHVFLIDRAHWAALLDGIKNDAFTLA